jgi:hypothetical protein
MSKRAFHTTVQHGRHGKVLLVLKIGSIRDSTEPRAPAMMRYEEK